MIRILHSVSNMDRAGIETMLMNYYRHMDRERIQFDFLLNKNKPGAYDDEIVRMGGRLFRTPGLEPSHYRAYMRYVETIFQKHPEYRILHAHNGAFALQALRAAQKSGVPVRIFHAHGAAIDRDWKFPLKMACRSLLPMYVTQQFACSRAAARCYFGRQAREREAYVWLPNAIDTERFCYQERVRGRIRQEYALGDSLVIGHVGRFVKQKNHAFLLRVFAQIKRRKAQAMLVLIGDGPLEGEVRREAKRLGIGQSVILMGNVADVHAWYQAFDVFILPSIWEGLPLVGIEAQAADLPCMFSDAVTREVDAGGRVRFLSLRETPAQWAEQALTLERGYERKDRTRTIQNAGYDVRAAAQRLEEIYVHLSEGVEEK